MPEWYLDFVDLSYTPKEDDLIALFRIEPAEGVKMEEAAGRVASESSIGTWTTLTTLKPSMRMLMAKVYEIRESWVKIAYPLELFEEGSIAGLMSAVAGNIFGMKALEALKLIDLHLPREYLRKFKGPTYGKTAIKKIFRKSSGPITAVVPKPKVGFTAQEHAAEVGYTLWKGGIDCIKDDENLTSQKFNRFEKRVELLARFREKAEGETGEVKEAFINVTANCGGNGS
ncbi:MAG: RuBisCO large subunit C-terminal-like domain-containing protein [Candidatus Hadarchaeales archaeon]